MKITVSNGISTKSRNFPEGTTASEAIRALGFDFPMPCGGHGRCGKCVCTVNGVSALACTASIRSDSFVEISAAKSDVLTAQKSAGRVNGTVIDIGTTTIAAASFKDGMPVRTIGMRNPQCSFGADVISRIGAKDTRPLTDAINSTVKRILDELGRPAIIVGNTAMLALLLGLNVSHMGQHPFPMPSTFDMEYEGAYIPPCAGAFVGADALCSMIWSGADEGPDKAMVMDLGTNGEIGLKTGNEIYFTSAAAGPAMEGAGISRGMAAQAGAVCHVSPGGCQVIRGERPMGLCGSGLVDAIALMLRTGFMDRYGALEDDFQIPGSDILITQEDVRAYQLCKGAISAAALVLAESSGISITDIERIYLSGALGKNINIKNAIYTGLLPRVDENVFVPVGNGALMGGALLLEEKNRGRIRRLAQGCRCVNLASDPYFTEKYIESMNF